VLFVFDLPHAMKHHHDFVDPAAQAEVEAWQPPHSLLAW